MKRLSIKVESTCEFLYFKIFNDDEDIVCEFEIQNINYFNDPDLNNSLDKLLNQDKPFHFNWTDGHDYIQFKENIFIIGCGGYPYDGMFTGKYQFKLSHIELIQFKHELKQLKTTV